MNPVKINSLEIENVKRVKAVALKPTKNGLTVIGGKNGEGKTSVLDAIAWALGGEDFRPTHAKRDSSVIPPNIHIVLNNGIVVERKGKNSSLKVTDPSGEKAGQTLLNSFIEALAINPPKFMEANSRDKARTLLKIIGVADEVERLEQLEKDKFNERQAVGRVADQKEKYAKEQQYYPDAPEEPVSASELIKQQQKILARNGENQRKRERLKEITFEKHRIYDEAQRIEEQIKDLQSRLEERKKAYEQVSNDEEIAMRDVADLQDESTAELERSIADIDEINRKVRANLDKEKAEEDARRYREQYSALTTEIENARAEKKKLLDDAGLPLPGLSVENGELIYNGQKWDCMSGSEQLKVSAAIIRKVKPGCGFILMDKLEQMDIETLKDFGKWAEGEGLQIIATRVSTNSDGECSIIIEDGYSLDPEGNRTAETTEEVPEEKPKKTWTKGAF